MEPRPSGEFDRKEMFNFFKIINIHYPLQRHTFR